MPQPFAISPAQLSRLIGTPDAPMIVDVRLPEDLASLPRTLPASSLIPHAQIGTVLRRPTDGQGQDGHGQDGLGLDGRRVVVVCMAGRKLSEGAAAILRAQGTEAEILDGGALAWAEADLPMTPIAQRPSTHLWVTRHRPKIDRIACPWLIRRWIDPAAQFLYVAPSEVNAVADRFSAIAFDIEGGTYTHKGSNCTFDALLDSFGLHTPALDRLATVIRGADTDTHDLAPQAAGLLAVSVGLSRMYRDDLAMLNAGMLIYDALYRWARDGFDEGHDWPESRKG